MDVPSICVEFSKHFVEENATSPASRTTTGSMSKSGVPFLSRSISRKCSGNMEREHPRG